MSARDDYPRLRWAEPQFTAPVGDELSDALNEIDRLRSALQAASNDASAAIRDANRLTDKCNEYKYRLEAVEAYIRIQEGITS